MKENVKNALKYLALALAVVVLTVSTAVITHNRIYKDTGLTDYNYMIYRDRTELALEGCKDAIVSEIDNYIDSIAPDSGLNGIKLFELCDKYDVDVRFAMAQAQAESHYGTKGMAAKTNIVWNVNTRDGDKLEDIRNRKDDFDHPDKSIEPYLILLTTKYLVDGKDEMDMFDKFVNSAGQRYASNPNYESLVQGIYEKIDKETKLGELIREYRKYQRKLAFGA